MRYLKDLEEEEARKYLFLSAEVAKKSTCLKSKCGSIIVKDNRIIGSGFNSPPKDLESQRKCLCDKKELHPKVGDKSCCIHAEQRAIIDALRKNHKEIGNSRLYFIRLDQNNQLLKAGKPYCTICSKMALDVGIKEFVLWHEDGICVYDTEEYNLLSFQFMD